MQEKKESHDSCSEKSNETRAHQSKSCAEEKALKHNANSSSVDEVKSQSEAVSKKKHPKVAEKPADYVVDPEDEDKVEDAGSDKFGTRGT